MSDAKISEAAVDVAAFAVPAAVPTLEDAKRVVRQVVALYLQHSQPAELADASVVEQIAQQWDGCQYDAPGEMVDIGAAIRRAGKLLSAELAEQQGVDGYDKLADLIARLYMARDMERAGAWSYLFAEAADALAATGKQQVGEVLGDAVRALPSEWRERAEELDLGDAAGVTHHWKLKDCADELEAALAARQPGAQVPVGQVRTRVDGVFIAELFPGVADRVSNMAPLYVAPPAQGIDLGQQQDAARWRWVREQNGVTVSVEEADDDGDMTFVTGHTPEELDAAIDSQRDAAPGV